MDTRVRVLISWATAIVVFFGIIAYLITLSGEFGSLRIAKLIYAGCFVTGSVFLCWCLKDQPKPVFLVSAIFLTVSCISLLINSGFMTGDKCYLTTGVFLGLLFVSYLLVR